jgi:hypothetical protein
MKKYKNRIRVFSHLVVLNEIEEKDDKYSPYTGQN